MVRVKATEEANDKRPGLSIMQIKEIQEYAESDFTQFPGQPCVRSLYCISKIAQNQQIKIIVPPTVLIGFGDDHRMMFNDPVSGFIIVKSGYISPKDVEKFLLKHVTKY